MKHTPETKKKLQEAKAHLPAETVAEIRKAAKDGMPRKLLLERFGLRDSVVSDIVNRKSYTYQ